MKVGTATGKGRKRQETTADRGRLHPGEVVRGFISDHNYDALTYTVEARGQQIVGCRDFSGLCGSLLSFKKTERIPVGTPVALLYGSPPWILGSGTEDPPDMDSYASRTSTGLGVKGANKTLNPDSHTVPPHNSLEDTYQGEFEIANLVGTFIRFFTFMASLGSGERAKIEFHVLRDLVRLVSRNFEHFSAVGDLKIFDDGRLNTEINGTTYDHERWGRLTPNSPKFEAPDTGMPEVDPMETGRWRYTFLLGFAGDLFNGWFTDPVESVGRMAEEAMRSGKARIHVGQDGTLLWQSCSEIVMEKVTRVQVPIRIRHEEDPQGVLRKEMDELDRQFLKVWNQGGEKNEHHNLFKLREYARYLNQYHSLARLHQQAKDWKVPSEAETPAPQVGAGEKDKTDANPGGLTYWKDCYATIRIFRDGSTLVYDGYGNATATGPYGIQHSSARHYHVYASGDGVFKFGGSMFLSARRHVELVASRGTLLLKSRTGLRALCEKGMLWLKSDFDPDNLYQQPEGDPAPEYHDRHGIRIQATSSEARWISKLRTRIAIKHPDEKLEIDARGGVTLQTLKDVLFNISGSLNFAVKGAVRATARRWDNWLPGGWTIDRVCSLKPGVSEINRIKTYGLLSLLTIRGPKRLGIPEPDTFGPLRPHTNHIDAYDPDKEGPLDLGLERPGTVDNLPPDVNSFQWKLLPAEEYRWSTPAQGGKTDVDFIEPLAQQTLRLDSPEGYGVWPGMSDVLMTAEQTFPDTPWPNGMQWLQHNPVRPSLNTPTGEDASSFSASIQTPLTLQSPNFKFLLR